MLEGGGAWEEGGEEADGGDICDTGGTWEGEEEEGEEEALPNSRWVGLDPVLPDSGGDDFGHPFPALPPTPTGPCSGAGQAVQAVTSCCSPSTSTSLHMRTTPSSLAAMSLAAPCPFALTSPT